MFIGTLSDSYVFSIGTAGGMLVKSAILKLFMVKPFIHSLICIFPTLVALSSNWKNLDIWKGILFRMPLPEVS